MINSQLLDKVNQNAFGDSSLRWVAILAHAEPRERAGFEYCLISGAGPSQKLYLVTESRSIPPVWAQHSGCGVIFEGALYNPQEVQESNGEMIGRPEANDAEVILAAYRRSGEHFLSRLRGTFALVLWDSSRDLFMCLRDPLGSHPLFYSETNGDVLVSPAISQLTGHPQVSGAVNRAAMADYILDRHAFDETFFEAVRRVPPGHVLRFAQGHRNLFRYWDPAPDGVVKWLKRNEVERFDELLDGAVNRCLSLGTPGIFLSGGLDSVSVAATALEHTRVSGSPKPLALSLVFPERDISEEVVQRAVAEQLGLPQVLNRFYDAPDAKGTGSVLAPALAMSASLSAPIINPWMPAYAELAREGRSRGCDVILTGGGGDEWLTVGPFLAADLMREMNVVGLYRLWQSMSRSYRRPNFALLKSLFWRCGAKPLLHGPTHKVIKRVAPWALNVRRRVFLAPPRWIAPKDDLRNELRQRREGSSHQIEPSGSFYIDDGRKALDHALVSWESEEMFEVYQKAGVRVVQPYWDPDLLDLLYRTPPFMLLRDGRNKGLVRRSLSKRFPQLGFEQQQKVEALNFYTSAVHREGPELLKKLGKIRFLGDLGIVDERRLYPEMERVLARRQTGTPLHRFWNILNLESWVRTHAS